MLDVRVTGEGWGVRGHLGAKCARARSKGPLSRFVGFRAEGCAFFAKLARSRSRGLLTGSRIKTLVCGGCSGLHGVEGLKCSVSNK